MDLPNGRTGLMHHHGAVPNVQQPQNVSHVVAHVPTSPKDGRENEY